MTRQIFAVIAFLVLTAQASLAAQYNVTVSGTLNNYSATLFGDASLTIPLTFTFKVDSADAQLIPANTAFNGDGYRFATDAYRVPKAALTNLSVTIGNATFTNADLLTQTLDLAGSYDLLIMGSLASPTAVNMSFTDAALGELYIGALSCPTTTCSIIAAGSAFSYQDGGFGEFATLFVSSQEVSSVSTPSQKADALIALLASTPVSNKGLSKVLTFDLQSTKKLITDGELVSAKKSLHVFMTHVRAAQNGGSITAAEADALVAKALELQSSL